MLVLERILGITFYINLFFHAVSLDSRDTLHRAKREKNNPEAAADGRSGETSAAKLLRRRFRTCRHRVSYHLWG